MDDDKLKKLFENQEIPEPSEDARTRALKAAMEEFEAQKEKTAEPAKGITWFARLMGKTEDKGGSPIMNALNFRNVSIAATVAVALIVVSIVLSPEFRKLERNNFATRPAIQEQQEMPREVADADKKDFQKERPATATVPVKKEQALTEKRSAEPVLPSAPPQPAEGAVAVEQESFRMADAEMDIAEEAVAPAAKPSPSFSANQGLVAEKKVMRREKALGYGGASTRSSGDIAAPIPPEYVGRDQFEHKEVNPVKVVREEPVSTFSVDVDTA
ncbi:MAG: hypothetical protein GWM98_00525 [Nitrospinaceae bacterium]|nr:hypothetical protein [Nitrospinaceae bacterium]